MQQYLPYMLAVNILAVITGAFFKIMHWGFSETILAAGLMAYLAFLIVALIEVFRNPRFSSGDKFRWAVVLTFLGSLGGILYMSRTRRDH